MVVTERTSLRDDNNIFELGDKEASDMMTHRTNMTALDGAMLLGDAVHFILNEGIK